jgi:hypothetical protein
MINKISFPKSGVIDISGKSYKLIRKKSFISGRERCSKSKCKKYSYFYGYRVLGVRVFQVNQCKDHGFTYTRILCVNDEDNPIEKMS